MSNSIIDDYFNSFISKLPTNNIIYTSKNTKIDIKDELYNIKSKLIIKDGNIVFEFLPNKYKTLDEYYQLLLNNEYKKPTLEDKQELLESSLNLLRDIAPNFMSVYNSEMSTGIKFNRLIKALARYIDDDMNLVINGRTENISDYIYNLYFYQVAYLDYKYNKAYDSPSKVTELTISRKHGDSVVTGELPVILTSDDRKSLTSYKTNQSINLNNYYQLIPNLNIYSLEEIKSKIEYYQPTNDYENIYKEFLLEKCQKRENTLSESNNIIEDYKTIIEHKLDNLTKKITESKSVFERGYQDISNQITELNNELNDILIECINYNINETHKIESIRELLNKYEIEYNHLYNKKNRNKNRAIISLEESYMKIRKKINNVISSSTFNGLSSGYELGLNKEVTDFKKLLEEYFENNLINNDEYQEWNNKISDLLNYYNLNNKEERGLLL